MIIVATICSWCGTTQELNTSDESWPTAEDEYVETHTICTTCAKRLLEE